MSTSRTFRGLFWWIDGTRWGVWECKECNTGDGEDIEGYEDGGTPLPFVSLQTSRGAKRRWITWQEEPGGGWRCAGISGKNFFGCFSSRSTFQLLVCCGLAGLADEPGFSRVDWEGRDEWKVKVLLLKSSVLFILLSVLDTALWAKVLANKHETKSLIFCLWM